MSISKLFVKVFNEDIFEHLDSVNSDLEDDFDTGNCSNIQDTLPQKTEELSVSKWGERFA